MRHLSIFGFVSVALLAAVSGGHSASAAGLKLNPYPTQSRDAVVHSDQLDESVVRELLARKRQQAAGAAPVSLKEIVVEEVFTVPVEAPVIAPVSLEPEVQVIRATPIFQNLNFDETVEAVVVKPAPIVTHVLEIEYDAAAQNAAKREAARQLGLLNDVVEADFVPVVAEVEAVAEVEVVAAVDDNSQEAAWAAARAQAARQLAYTAPDNVPVATPAIQKTVAPILAEKTVSPRPVVASTLSPEPVVTAAVPSSYTPYAPVSNLPALDRVTVVVQPRASAAAVAPAPVQASVAQPVIAQPVVTQTVTREATLSPVAARVASLDDAAAFTPAQLQEQALLRGVQSNTGQIITDPLEGDAFPAFNPRDAKTLLNEADAILEGVKGDAIDGRALPETLVADIDVETLAPPIGFEPIQEEEIIVATAEVLAPVSFASEPVVNSNNGNRVIYNEDNIREVMDAVSQPPVSLLAPAPLQSSDVVVSNVVATPPQDISTGWAADDGMSVYGVLSEWSQAAGVQLVWDSEFLPNVKAPLNLSGSYEEAVAALFDQYRGMRTGVEGTLYLDGGAGQKILHVQTNS